MAAAFAWGTLAAFSLVIGAVLALVFRISLRVIGLIMAFGGGVTQVHPMRTTRPQTAGGSLRPNLVSRRSREPSTMTNQRI